MSIRINAQCIACLIQRNLERVEPLGDGHTATAFTRDLMELILSAPEDASSAWFGPGIDDLLKKHYGLEGDRFREEKIRSNRFVMERLEQIRARVEGAEDPVFAALQFAILGNYLDFAALRDQVSFEKLEEMLSQALSMELDPDCYRDFRADLEKGGKLLYLTDNAGEIVFDRVLAEQIQKAYPQMQITFCVRGGVVHNDATREDAAAVGIPFPVIDNGNNIGGTRISEVGEEAKRALDGADVILAKGMGNTESMFGCGYNVYYAFLVKCGRFQREFQKPMFTPMFVKERK